MGKQSKKKTSPKSRKSRGWDGLLVAHAEPGVAIENVAPAPPLEPLPAEPQPEVLPADDELAAVARLIVGEAVASLRTAQDSLAQLVESVRDVVPEERRRAVPAEIGGPVLEVVRYVQPSGPRFRHCHGLVATSCDDTTRNDAHPVFARIIGELSDDEARLLDILSDHNGLLRRFYRFYRWQRPQDGEISCHEYEVWSLESAEKLPLYVSHLVHLGLIRHSESHSASKVGKKQIYYDEISLTPLGRAYCAACVVRRPPIAAPTRALEQPAAGAVAVPSHI